MNEQTAAPTDAAPQDAVAPEQALLAAEDRIAALEAELAEMKERWMRAEAENANVRARARKDVDDTRQYAVQKFAIVGKVREGLDGVQRSFVATLERNGIKQTDPIGQPFDPNLHQAMAEQESETHAPGTVIQAWSQAWTLNGRLLRPAMVVVAKAPAPELTGPAQG